MRKLIVAVAGAVAVCGAAQLLKTLFWKPFPGPPGLIWPRSKSRKGSKPKGSTFGEQLEEFSRSFGVKGQDYSYPISYRRMGRLIVQVSTPKECLEVLKKRPETLHRPAIARKLISVFDRPGLFLAEGDDWRKMRRHYAPAFNHKNVEMMLSVINSKASALCDALEKMGTVEELRTWAQYCTVDVICQVSFGIDMDFINRKSRSPSSLEPEKVEHELLDLMNGHWDDLSKAIRKPMTTFLATMLPRWLLNKLKVYRKTFDRRMKVQELIRGIVRERRAELQKNPSQARNDLLDQAILECTEGQDMHWKDEHMAEMVCTNVSTFFNAGSETVSSSLSFMMLQFCKHPEWQAKCRKQLQPVMLRSMGPSIDHLDRCTYLRACMLETLRLFPVAPFLNSEVKKPGLTIRGVEIPVGSVVYAMTRMAMTENSDLQDPEVWDPQRWLDGNDQIKTDYEKTVSPLLGFGAGSRVCPGKRMAEVELLAICAHILTRFQNFESTIPLEEIKMKSSLSYYPSPLSLRFEPLRSSPFW